MDQQELHGIREFLKDYPGMSRGPSRGSETVLKGVFSFSAKPREGKEITDSYELEIVIPSLFPRAIPKVTEKRRKIPRDGKHHVNPDGTLCLGSPLRLLRKIAEKPTLVGFSEKCLVPYLYAISNKLQNGGEFAFSELAHGNQGIIDDYLDMFKLKTRAQVIQTLKLLGMKRRIANKAPCPCGCGLRLGKCPLHLKLKQYRNMAPRSWFREHVAKLR